MRRAPHRGFASECFESVPGGREGPTIGRADGDSSSTRMCESAAMPGNDRLWFDDNDRRAPLVPNARQPDPQQAVRLSLSRRPRDRLSTCSWCRNASTSSCRRARERAELRRVRRSESNTDGWPRSVCRGCLQGQPCQQVRTFQ